MKSSLKTIGISILGLFVILVTSQTLHADVPDAPENLTVEMDFETPGVINRFQWEGDDDEDVDGYRLYVRTYDWDTEEVSDWQLLRDEIEETETALGINDLMNTLMSFHVRAYNEDGESGPSNGVSVTRAGRVFDNFDYIEVLLNDGALGLVGPAPDKASNKEEFRYDVNVVAERLQGVVPVPQVTYQLDGAPMGMTINSANGEIVWSQPVEGTHQFSLQVMEGASVGKTYDWTLEVSGVTSVRESRVLNSVTVYPNPTTDIIRTRFTTTDAQTTVRIVTALGQLVYSRTVASTPGENTISVPVRSLGAGAYYLYLGASDGVRTLPFSITR